MPEASIIVCTYNRDKYIGKALECLNNQNVDTSLYEVIIVDNNSSDSTASICRDFIKENEAESFHYFLEKQQGHTYARNRGIEESKGSILGFLDDDAFVKEDYIQKLLGIFTERSEVSAIGGKIKPVYESGVEPKWMSKYLHPLVAALDMGNQIRQFRGTKFPIGANMAFRKEVFHKYGMFDVNLGRRGDGLEGGDEKDVFNRIKKDNHVILYHPGLEVEHVIPEKRLDMTYIKGLAIGVGTSERKRLGKLGWGAMFKKWMSELIKIGASIVLFIGYLFSGKPVAAFMLLRFRFWVLRGLTK